MALEYVAHEALRMVRISGTISPKFRKRRRASPSQRPTPAAATTTAATTAPEPLVAICAVFVKPESTRKQTLGNRFTNLWPRADSSLVSTISSIIGQSMQALATTLMPILRTLTAKSGLDGVQLGSSVTARHTMMTKHRSWVTDRHSMTKHAIPCLLPRPSPNCPRWPLSNTTCHASHIAYRISTR